MCQGGRGQAAEASDRLRSLLVCRRPRSRRVSLLARAWTVVPARTDLRVAERVRSRIVAPTPTCAASRASPPPSAPDLARPQVGARSRGRRRPSRRPRPGCGPGRATRQWGLSAVMRRGLRKLSRPHGEARVMPARSGGRPAWLIVMVLAVRVAGPPWRGVSVSFAISKFRIP